MATSALLWATVEQADEKRGRSSEPHRRRSPGRLGLGSEPFVDEASLGETAFVGPMPQCRRLALGARSSVRGWPSSHSSEGIRAVARRLFMQSHLPIRRKTSASPLSGVRANGILADLRCDCGNARFEAVREALSSENRHRNASRWTRSLTRTGAAVDRRSPRRRPASIAAPAVPPARTGANLDAFIGREDRRASAFRTLDASGADSTRRRFRRFLGPRRSARSRRLVPPATRRPGPADAGRCRRCRLAAFLPPSLVSSSSPTQCRWRSMETARPERPASTDDARPRRRLSLTSDDRTVSTPTMRAAGTGTATRNVGLLGVQYLGAFGVAPVVSKTKGLTSTKPALVTHKSPMFRDPIIRCAILGLQAYSDALDKNPITTKAMTSLVGWCLGDLLAQVG
ncbi:hypothetical protein ACHAWF_014519 [Thalassiosira exigua]